MAYSPKVTKTARKRFEERKIETKLINDRRHSEICEKIPEYGKLETELAETMSTSFKAIADKSADSDEIIRCAMDRNVKIQKRMVELLINHGYPGDYLSKIYYCDKCRDTGIGDGEWCECYSQLLRTAAAEEFNENSMLSLCSFEDFKLNYYPDNDKTDLGISSREAMKKNRDTCIEFAKSFDGKGAGLFLTGRTGVGKTHLSLSIANELIKRGFSVIYDSVPMILSALEKESFGRSDTDLMPMLTSCDLLILDDLGTEYKSDRFPMFLYEIINTRRNRLLPMIISTNLNMRELEDKYQSRIFSRIVSMNVIMCYGGDIRFKLK